MTYTVTWSESATEDLLRLQDFLYERARYREDVDIADRALHTIATAVQTQLAQAPLIHRKAADGRNPLRRELLIPFGNTGYLALYEIIPTDRVLVLAVRHLLEQDYH